MVCEKCQKKQSTLLVPDKWRDGAKNVTRGNAAAGPSKKEAGGRQIGQNMLLAKKKSMNKYGGSCKICKSKIDGAMIYCQACAYKKGLCGMCGKMILNTKFYKQSSK
eukprot:GFYU01005708.1.p1 GENE.GFYU01005708.1~~GFYU01005708.1.p1  ORF type:complete len:107 (+),score=23.96 GFYU01005708.1:124-444(+)